MKVILIKSDRHRSWYGPYVNKHLPLLGIDEDGFWSEEPSGPKNIVFKDDAEIINIPATQVKFYHG